MGFDHDLLRLFVAEPHEADRCGVSGGESMEFLRILHVIVVDFGDEITRFELCPFGRRFRENFRNEHAVGNLIREAEREIPTSAGGEIDHQSPPRSAITIYRGNDFVHIFGRPFPQDYVFVFRVPIIAVDL